MTPATKTESRPEPSLAVQSALLTGARVFGYVLAFFIPIVLVRIFSQTQFGLYKQTLLVAETVLPVLNLGLNASLFYFLPRNRRQGHHFILQALVLLWVLGLAGGLAIGLGAEPLARALCEPQLAACVPQLASLLPIAAAYVAFSQPGDVLLYLPIIDRRPVVAAVLTVTNEALKLAVAATAAVVYRTVSAVLLGTVILAVLRALVLLVYVRSRGRDEGGRVNRADLRRQLGYALPYAAAVVLEIALTKAHHYFVSTNVTSAQFAIYSTGVVQIPIAALLSTSVAEVLLVRASAVYPTGDLVELHRLWIRSVSRLCVFIVPIWLGAEFFAPDLIDVLFGTSYLTATPVLRIFLFASLLTIIIDHGILRAVGDTRFLFLANGLGLAVSLAWMAATPELYTLTGAVSAYVVGFGTTRVLGLARVAHRLGVPLHRSFPFRSLMTAAVLAGVATAPFWLLTRSFASPLARLAVGVPIVAVVYGLLVLATGLVSRDEALQLLARFRLKRAPDTT